MIDGILFAVQYLVLTRDEPTFAEELIHESGYSEEEFLRAQQKTGYQSKKVNAVIRTAFSNPKD